MSEEVPQSRKGSTVLVLPPSSSSTITTTNSAYNSHIHANVILKLIILKKLTLTVRGHKHMERTTKF